MSKKKLKISNKLDFLFKKLDIKKGDNIIFHSNTAGIYQYKEKLNKKTCDLFLKFILNYIGPKGTLLIPTYNYRFTEREDYDRKKSKCQVGMFGNILLKKYFKSRTFAPIFNHLVFGKLKKDLFNCDYQEVFGDKSIFSKMYENNFKIICFCCPVNAMTFIHFIEKKMNVNYRFNKYFWGSIEKKKIKIKYYVGKKNINYSLKEKNILNIVNLKEFKEVSFGKFKSYSVNTHYLFKKLKEKIKKQNNYLIKN